MVGFFCFLTPLSFDLNWSPNDLNLSNICNEDRLKGQGIILRTKEKSEASPAEINKL